MNTKRQKIETWCIDLLKKIDPTGLNANIYKDKVFKPMTDTDFHNFIQDLKTKKRHLVIYAPNYGPVKLDVRRNIEIGKSIGRNFFEKVWIEGRNGLPTQLTPVTYFVIPVAGRRQAQLITKGVSVPKNMRTINALTGQPTGESQAAKISMPELNLCVAAGMNKSMIELMKYRGGDVRGGAALHGMLVRSGQASLQALQPFASGVESTNYVDALFTAAHIKTNLRK